MQFFLKFRRKYLCLPPPRGRRKGGPRLSLDFEDWHFPITFFAKKRLFFWFLERKTKFHHFQPLLEKSLRHVGQFRYCPSWKKIRYRLRPWKKSFRRPCSPTLCTVVCPCFFVCPSLYLQLSPPCCQASFKLFSPLNVTGRSRRRANRRRSSSGGANHPPRHPPHLAPPSPTRPVPPNPPHRRKTPAPRTR